MLIIILSGKERLIKPVVLKDMDSELIPGKSGQTWGAGFIDNKGEVQSFLLRGGPGVGKKYIYI